MSNEEKKNQVAKTDKSLRGLLKNDAVASRFKEIMNARAPAFITSIINVSESTPELKKISESNPMTIIRAAAVAASLDLPIDKNLGFSYIVPYSGQAQFQIGYKGYIQLAQRSGKYTHLTCVPIGSKEYKHWNPLTEDLSVVFSDNDKGEIVGFAVCFKLVNGFAKIAYFTKSELLAHGKKYSKTFKNGPWQTETDKMCMKTAIKLTLSKWGILSIEMQAAVRADQAIVVGDDIAKDTSFEYVDNDNAEIENKSDSKKPQINPDDVKPLSVMDHDEFVAIVSSLAKRAGIPADKIDGVLVAEMSINGGLEKVPAHAKIQSAIIDHFKSLAETAGA